MCGFATVIVNGVDRVDRASIGDTYDVHLGLRRRAIPEGAGKHHHDGDEAR